MKRQVLTILASLALGLVVSASPAAALTGPLLAGRPISYDGHTGNGCRVLAYGRVNGSLVIFLANHCYANTGEGVQIYDTSGTSSLIGTMGKRNSLWNDNDLTYIKLAPARIPTSGLNQVYRGSVAGNDYFTITHMPTAYTCSYMDSNEKNRVGGAFEPFQRTQATTDPYSSFEYTGNASNGSPDGCLHLTDLVSHNSLGICCDSGSPLIMADDPNTIVGVATGENTSTHRLYFNNLREGLNDLNDYLVANGGSGAWLCQTSTC